MLTSSGRSTYPTTTSEALLHKTRHLYEEHDPFIVLLRPLLRRGEQPITPNWIFRLPPLALCLPCSARRLYCGWSRRRRRRRRRRRLARRHPAWSLLAGGARRRASGGRACAPACPFRCAPKGVLAYLYRGRHAASSGKCICILTRLLRCLRGGTFGADSGIHLGVARPDRRRRHIGIGTAARHSSRACPIFPPPPPRERERKRGRGREREGERERER